MTKYSFPSGKFNLKLRTAVVTGVTRSGKTTLGNLLATHRNVEHADEPWLPNTLPVMVQLKMVDKKTGKEMFAAHLNELANDMILLRQANFRPNDLSSIWAQKTQKEIFFRLTKLQSRSDVRDFIKKNKPLFLLTLNGEPAFNLPALLDFLPNGKIVYVVRKGLDVARQIKEKRWFSDEQLARPPHAQIFRSATRRGKVFYVPCRIAPADAKKFLGYSEYERGLFYWCVLVENAAKSLENLRKKKQCLLVKFEELLENPRKIMKQASSFLDLKPSAITETALRKIKNYRALSGQAPKLSGELLARTKALYKYLGYGWD